MKAQCVLLVVDHAERFPAKTSREEVKAIFHWGLLSSNGPGKPLSQSDHRRFHRDKAKPGSTETIANAAHRIGGAEARLKHNHNKG